MKPPFFIVGHSRSGTTLLRLMLNSHPEVAIPHESVCIPELYMNLGKYGDLSVKKNMVRLAGDFAGHSYVRQWDFLPDFELLAGKSESFSEFLSLFYTAYARKHGKKFWGDKTPNYIRHMDSLHDLFPDAKFVHIIRDGRDVVLSHFKQGWSCNLVEAAEKWKYSVEIGRKMGRFIGSNYLEVNYEELVSFPESVLRRVCSFLGVCYSSKMLDYSGSARKVIPDDKFSLHVNVLKPPLADNVCLWKSEMSVSNQRVFESVAGDALNSFGYELVGLSGFWWKFKKLFWVFAQPFGWRFQSVTKVNLFKYF